VAVSVVAGGITMAGEDQTRTVPLSALPAPTTSRPS
jgi:hypothetical protein